MKDKELLFDCSCHVLYSCPCKKEIRAKIALHYPEAERETIWEQVQRQYADFLSDWRTDLGGKRNFHNGAAGDPGSDVFSELCGGRHALCGGGGTDSRNVAGKALRPSLSAHG